MKLRYSTLTACLVIWLAWLPSLAVNAEKIRVLLFGQKTIIMRMSRFFLLLSLLNMVTGCAVQQIFESSRLNNQAIEYYQQGRYKEAIPLFKRSLEIWENLYGAEHYNVAIVLNNLAEIYGILGDQVQAGILLERAVKKLEKHSDQEHFAAGLNNLASFYFSNGNPVLAESLFQRSLVIREKIFGKDHLAVAQNLNNLGLLYGSQSNYIQAERLLQQALGIFEKNLGQEHPDVATCLNNMAEFYKSQGDYARSESLQQRALAIQEKIFGQDHPDVATSLNNLAGLYENQHHYVRAKPLYQRALAIREKVFGKDHPVVAQSLSNLAVLYDNQNDHVSAEPLHQRALAIREKVLGKEHPEVAGSLNNLGAFYKLQGDYARAAPLYQRALKIAEKSSGPETLWLIQGNYSALLTKQNHSFVAIFFGKRAVNTLQKLRANVKPEFQKSFLQDKIIVYKNLANLLIDQGRLPEAEQVLAMLKQEEYFDFIRRDAQDDPRTAQAGFTTVEQPWAERYNKIHTQLADLGRKLGELNQKAKHTDLTATEETRSQQLNADMTVANQAFEIFLDELEQYFEKVPANRANFDKKDLRNLQALQSTLRDLGHGVVLVTYLMTEDKLRMILTSPEVQLARDAPVTEKQLNQTIAQFRDALKDRRADTQDLAKELYDWLIKPIANDLAQAQPQVLMVYLDSTLRYIPLAALYDGSHYLAEKYAVVMYTAAARDKLKDRPTEHWKLAGLGLTQKIAGFDQLTEVEQELRMIVRRTPEDKEGVIDGVVYLNQDFTAKRLSDLLRKGYPVMHIASHFRFSPTGNDTTSFLLLGDGNKLTLADIKNQYKFPDVDLLTLSACDTAMGNQGTGKEIESFGVLAQRNGAKGVLASLWPVYDTSTAVFMKHLYQLRSTGTTPLNKALALQAAQRVFIEGQEGEKYKHPYYWAPFILMGNWL